MTLRQLEIGDIFIHASCKDPHPRKFLVRGNSVFNPGHGRPTRSCIDMKTKKLVGKSCPLEVIKTGESTHKEAMKLKPQNLR